MFLKQRKKILKNKSVLPDELSAVTYSANGSDAPLSPESENFDVSASKRVPVLAPQLSSYLVRLGIAVAVLLILQTLNAFSTFFLATKPAPDLVQQDNGVMARVRPLDHRTDSVPEQVVSFLEERLPRVYTWSGLLVNPDDPAGLSYIRDSGVSVATTKGDDVLVPITLYNEQFIFDEPIRASMLQAIAQMIKDGEVDKKIFANDPAQPAIASIYRFILRGKIQYPQEVSTGRWKVRVAADIVLFSPNETLGVKPKQIAEFVQDVYVRKASPIPQLFIHDQKQQDLVWYGRSDGFVIDAMLPVGPAQEVPGVPRN
jgi:hypothetical protein